jgi:predicted DNA-binding transcriptional regulator YafY
VQHQAELGRYRVTIRVAAGAMAELRWRLGSRIRGRQDDMNGSACEDLDLTFDSLEDAREKLLGLGRAVEVLHPPALRLSIRDYAEQVLALYEGREGG